VTSYLSECIAPMYPV